MAPYSRLDGLAQEQENLQKKIEKLTKAHGQYWAAEARIAELMAEIKTLLEM